MPNHVLVFDLETVPMDSTRPTKLMRARRLGRYRVAYSCIIKRTVMIDDVRVRRAF
jgi:hypothetical protein